jgi:beta-N-acetylhexosaminidase
MSELGQLVMTGISGVALTDEEKEFIEKENIGGVLLFSHNYENPAQLAELVNAIQVLRQEYPLFIAVDQEGGRVQRFKGQFTILPSMFELAKTNSPKLCYHIAKICADELSACGINVNLAPVCDTWTNPANKVIGDRAYSTDPEQVSKFVSSAIRGFQTNGIIACAKHFPGHGGTTKDSHFDLPLVKRTMEELRDCELKPFVKAVKSRVEFLMMAHLLVDAIDEELPTSLSPKAYEIVRKELKYTKIIITDDMQMKAVTDRFGIDEGAVMAIMAGADIVEYRDMAQAMIALEALKEAKKTKRLKNEAIKLKVDRITDCKKEYFGEYRPIYIPDIAKKVNTRATQVFMQDVLEKIKNGPVEDEED